MHSSSSSSGSRLQRQSLAALRRHLRSLDKAAAAPVMIALSQSSQSILTGVGMSMDQATATPGMTAALLAHTDNNVLAANNVQATSSSSSSSSSASISVNSPSSSSSGSSSFSQQQPPQPQQQQQQQQSPPPLRRSARNAVSTRTRAAADKDDEATQQRLLALYRRAGNCLRFRVNHLPAARLAHYHAPRHSLIFPPFLAN